MKALLLAGALLVVVIGIYFSTSGNSQERQWAEQGKEWVKLKLKDPESAQFRGVHARSGPENLPVTCGEVNSKNSLGGYVGFQRFVSIGDARRTILENEVPARDFNQVWAMVCNKA